MPFYHDPESRTVAYMPDHPQVYYKKGKNRQSGLWIVSTTIEYTIADNFILPETGQWRHPIFSSRQEQYLDCRDSKEDALRYFRMNHSPSMPVVDQVTFLHYRQLYSDIANRNKPSSNIL
jgi:hypothetical protein